MADELIDWPEITIETTQWAPMRKAERLSEILGVPIKNIMRKPNIRIRYSADDKAVVYATIKFYITADEATEIITSGRL